MDKMEFNLGNTQEEAPKRILKKPKKKKTLLFVILTAVVLIAVLIAVLWDANSFDGLRRRVIYARAQKDENGCAEREDCNTCRFYRPCWKYQFCVFEECPYQPGRLTAIQRGKAE